jgi:hypothetical protein
MNTKSPEAFKRFLIDTGKASLERDAEFLPTVVLEDHNGQAIVMILAGGHPFDMLGGLIPILREHRPTTVSITMDSYVTQGEEGFATRERYGDLSQAFAAGAPGVTEALTIQIVTPDSMDFITLPYTREDDGYVTWGEPHEAEGTEVAGRMADALRMVWA